MENNRESKYRYLIGKGGVGLVMFHLARRRIEFAVASDHCPLGDIWIDIKGKKVGVEVKTCSDIMQWQVRKAQITRVEFYVLVCLQRGACFVLSSGEMGKAYASGQAMYGDVALVKRDAIPADCEGAWHKLGGRVERPFRTQKMESEARAAYRSTRVVRRVMKNGDVKMYEYLPNGERKMRTIAQESE